MSRSIVFDLDDTLYPERRFVLSGFSAIAVEMERLHGVPAAEAFGVLRRAYAQGRRGTALQELAARYYLAPDSVRWFRSFFRGHDPRLRLPKNAADVLAELRRGWKIGILTNGIPDVQARKVAALGLSVKVDAVVYALNTGNGKPEPAAFEAVLDRLKAPAAESVFVGDDPWCDISGARAAGMKTIRIRQGVHKHAAIEDGHEADVVVNTLTAVPVVAERLHAEVTCGAV